MKISKTRPLFFESLPCGGKADVYYNTVGQREGRRFRCHGSVGGCGLPSGELLPNMTLEA
jgi:hypothetical protein